MYFLVKFDESGNLKFASKQIERKYNSFKGYYMRTGTYFKMALDEMEEQSTDAQHKLFFRICYMMSDEGGNTFREVMKAMCKEHLPWLPTGNCNLLGEPTVKQVELADLTIPQYSVFLESVVQSSNEMFDWGLEIYTNEEFKTVIKTNKDERQKRID